MFDPSADVSEGDWRNCVARVGDPFRSGRGDREQPEFADAQRAWMVLAADSNDAFTPIGHGRRLGVNLMACGVAQLVSQVWWLYYSRRRLKNNAGAHGYPPGRTLSGQ